MPLGLRTVIYKVSDLSSAKTWYSKLLDKDPYFDQPFYVGFNVGGYELGLDPDVSKKKPGAGGSVAYWGVQDLAAMMSSLEKQNVKVSSTIQDVGEGIKVATIFDPFGNEIGLIENPHFKLPE